MNSVCLIIKKVPECGLIPTAGQMEFLDQRAWVHLPMFLSERQETCEEVTVPFRPFEPTRKNTKIDSFKRRPWRREHINVSRKRRCMDGRGFGVVLRTRSRALLLVL